MISRILLVACGCSMLIGLDLAAARQENERPAYRNTQPLDIPFASAADALKQFKLPPGFKVSLFASEPNVQQPIAVTTDHRGRLWVVECYTYSDRKTNYDMSVKDRVVIFEDTDGDGRHDKRTVFWDQGEKLTGIEVGFGGVWLTSAPHFIFLPDRNADDQPDGPPEILLDGFEDHVIRHNIVNGLRWGHDGWLYGRHGIQATSFVGPPGATESQRVAMNCSIWRFHPTLRKFEIVAQGGTNPWGFDFDEMGEMFMINTVIGHLFHVVPGARYRRMYGTHFNPHTYQVIEQTADHFHFAQGEDWAEVRRHGISSATDAAGGGHAHTGLMIYLGDNWPREFRNSLFTANFHGLRINRDTIAREGNGYVGRHAPDFIHTTDQWFRGVELVYGPDGGVFLLDWSDIGECHENDGIHRTSGRIYKITYGAPGPPQFPALTTATVCIANHLHENDWFYRKTRRELQQRTANGDSISEIAGELRELLRADSSSTRTRLRAMWTLYSTNNINQDDLISVSRHSNEHVRAWAIRLLCDGLLEITPAVDQRLIELAASDPSGLVRLYLASGLARLTDSTRFQVAEHLALHGSDADDRTQPHLLWFGIEPVIVSQPARAVSLARRSKIPLLTENIARRLAFENEDPSCRAAVTDWLAEEKSPRRLATVIRGIDKAYRGWNTAVPPDNWKLIAKKARRASPELADAITRLDIVFGDGASLEFLRKTAQNAQLDSLVRSRAIESVANARPNDLFDFLKALARDKSVLTQVVKSAVRCQNPAAARMIINKYGNCDQAGKQASITTLVARSQWAMKLLEAVEQGRIPKSMITAWHARQINQFQDAALTAKLAKVWGQVRQTDSQRVELVEQLRNELSQSEMSDGDLKAGGELFQKNCANCHVLYGKGSRIGPDLTGSDRKNLNYLLENLVDPSSLVAESYQMKVYLLDDGRTISGLILSENPKTVEIQTPDDIVTIAKESIESQRQTKLSLMPDGLLDKLSAKERADLFAYLMSDR